MTDEGRHRRKREERAVVIPLPEGEEAADLALEGLFVAGAAPGTGGALIAAPHPLFGGSMDSPVVSELAWACHQAGLASLRFNWRGVGASAGVPSGDLAAASADLGAALRQLAASAEGPLVLCGYSFGAAAAVRVAPAERRVRRLVLVAPPPSLLGTDGLAGVDTEILVLVGEEDAVAPPDELADLAARHPRARLARIDAADHFFRAGLAELGRLTTEWLERR